MDTGRKEGMEKIEDEGLKWREERKEGRGWWSLEGKDRRKWLVGWNREGRKGFSVVERVRKEIKGWWGGERGRKGLVESRGEGREERVGGLERRRKEGVLVGWRE